MIKLEITADNTAVLLQELISLIDGWVPDEEGEETAPAVAAPAPALPIEPTDISVPKKTTRTKKATPPASDVTDINPTTGEAVSSAPAASPLMTNGQTPSPALDDVRNALKRLAKAKGENAVWDLLGKLDKDGRIKSATTAVQFGQGQALIDEVVKLVPANA